MAKLDQRIQKVRRIGISVFIVLAVAAIPIAVHIIETRESPDLWLTLLGAVFMMILISLYALETALAPMPDRRIATPVTVDPHQETVVQDETLFDEPPEVLAKTERMEPALGPLPGLASDDDGASLVEVEEIHTHPPFSGALGADLSEAKTELDPTRGHTANPDGPVMTVPNPSLRNTDSDEVNAEVTKTEPEA
jgi:hypothetical protein